MINMTFQGKDHDDLLDQIRDFIGESDATTPVEQQTISADMVSEEPAPTEFTLEDLKKSVSELAKTDRQKVKDVFARFDATRLSNVDDQHHSELYRLLTEAVDNG